MEPFERSYRLFCPGPVNVSAVVAQALTSYEFCHREEEFSSLLESLSGKILAAAGIRERGRYAAVVLTGSGTVANETVLSSAPAEGAHVLVLANGEFGERLAAISRIHNPSTTCLAHPWGEPLDLGRLRAHLAQNNRVDFLAMVHHETSTGLLNPVEEVGRIARERNIPLFVDAVSSFTADPLDLEAAGVWFMSSSSGKAVGCYPGLSLVLGRKDAFESLPRRVPRTTYLDLSRYYAFARERQQTPNTPAIPLFLALNKALELVLAEGLPARHARLQALAHRVRARVRALGLAILGDGQTLSGALTSVVLPDGLDFEALRRGMRERGFVIYGGKGPLTGRIFQVSSIGEIGLAAVDAFFGALADFLAEHSRTPVLADVAP